MVPAFAVRDRVAATVAEAVTTSLSSTGTWWQPPVRVARPPEPQAKMTAWPTSARMT